MILIACSDYSSTLTQVHLIRDLLTKNGFENQTYFIYANTSRFDISISKQLLELIKKAELILLFIQPYPLGDWEDPFETFFMMIYSFISSHPSAKAKTVYITPFVIRQRQNDLKCIEFMKLVIAKSKLGHFAIHPRDPSKFLNDPPLMDQFSYRPVAPETLIYFYNGIIALCKERIKKSE